MNRKDRDASRYSDEVKTLATPPAGMVAIYKDSKEDLFEEPIVALGLTVEGELVYLDWWGDDVRQNNNFCCLRLGDHYFSGNEAVHDTQEKQRAAHIDREAIKALKAREDSLK